MTERPTLETDHLENGLGAAARMSHPILWSHCRRLERERDEARDKLADWENAAAHVEADHPDEMHCGCVPVLRKLLTDARKERDEWYYKAHANAAFTLDARKERDEAREKLSHITDSAKAVVDRWELPVWKDAEPTASVIYKLRDALGREAE